MPNMMNGFNDFMKEMNELTNKNLEMMNKFWKTSIEQNDGNVEKNIQSYFQYLNTNIDYLNTIWNSNVKTNNELRNTYNENMKNLYDHFTKVYRETIEKAANKSQSNA